MKKFAGLLTLLALITTAASQASGQCFVKRHFPNYKAAVDGYAPADYDGDGKADWAIKDFSGAYTKDLRNFTDLERFLEKAVESSDIRFVTLTELAADLKQKFKIKTKSLIEHAATNHR